MKFSEGHALLGCFSRADNLACSIADKDWGVSRIICVSFCRAANSISITMLCCKTRKLLSVRFMCDAHPTA